MGYYSYRRWYIMTRSEEYQRLYNTVAKNSIKGRETSARERVSERAYRREKLKKEKFRRRVKIFITVVAASAIMGVAGVNISKTVVRDA